MRHLHDTGAEISSDVHYGPDPAVDLDVYRLRRKYLDREQSLKSVLGTLAIQMTLLLEWQVGSLEGALPESEKFWAGFSCAMKLAIYLDRIRLRSGTKTERVSGHGTCTH